MLTFQQRTTFRKHKFKCAQNVVRLRRSRLNAGTGRSAGNLESWNDDLDSHPIVLRRLRRISNRKGNDREADADSARAVCEFRHTCNVNIDGGECVIDRGGSTVGQDNGSKS